MEKKKKRMHYKKFTLPACSVFQVIPNFTL